MNQALSIDLHEWDNNTPEAKAAKPERKGPQLFKITSNISRNTFNAVRDNPGQTRVYIVRLLDKQGHNVKSTASLLTQMLRQGMIVEREGRLFAQQPEYTPLKSYATLKARKTQQKYKTPKQVQSKGIAALPAATTSAVAPAPVPAPAPQINSAWDADTLLNHLSIRQARALYDELHKIFGGKQ